MVGFQDAWILLLLRRGLTEDALLRRVFDFNAVNRATLLEVADKVINTYRPGRLRTSSLVL